MARETIFVETDPSFNVVLKSLKEVRDQNRLLVTHMQTASIEDIESNNPSENHKLIFARLYDFDRTASAVARMCMLKATNINPRLWPHLGKKTKYRNQRKMEEGFIVNGGFILADNRNDARRYWIQYDQLYPHFLIEQEIESVKMNTQIALPRMMFIVRSNFEQVIEITTTFNARRESKCLYHAYVHITCIVRSVQRRGTDIEDGPCTKLLKKILKSKGINNSYFEDIREITTESNLESLPDALDYLEIEDEEEEEEEEEEEPKMMALGNHKSLEEPPILPFFGSQTKKKQSQQDRLAETSGASMGASMATMRNDSSSNDDRRGKLLEQLKELKNLLDSDVLSRKEYDDQKSIVLQNLKDL